MIRNVLVIISPKNIANRFPFDLIWQNHDSVNEGTIKGLSDEIMFYQLYRGVEAIVHQQGISEYYGPILHFVWSETMTTAKAKKTKL